MPKDEWGGRFVDGGGDRFGRAKKVRKNNTERYECLRCDTQQIESVLARSRSALVRCRHCGNVVYPVTSKAAPEKPLRRCKNCKTQLRESNIGTLCSPCAQ